jgi:hypothetical protein
MITRYERMARSGDPLLREIGSQLSRGQIRPAGLLAVPEYLQVIRRGLARLDEVASQRATAAPAAGRRRDRTATTRRAEANPPTSPSAPHVAVRTA